MFKWSHQTIFLTLVGLASLMVYSVVLFSSGYSAGQAVGTAEIRGRLASVFPQIAVPIYSVTGTVTSVTDGQIEIQSDPVASSPLDAPSPVHRVITVAGNTLLEESVAPPSAPIGSLTSPKIVALRLSDLHPSDRVIVTAGSDIRLATDIGATKVMRIRAGQ